MFAGHQRKSFDFPTFDSADHLFHAPPQACQPQRSFVGAIAMRTAAINHEQCIFRVLCEIALIDSPMWQVDGRENVSSRKQLRAAYVEQYESFLARLHCRMNVP